MKGHQSQTADFIYLAELEWDFIRPGYDVIHTELCRCFKIGHSNNINKRLRGMQTAVPFPLHMTAVQGPFRWAARTEKFVRSILTNDGELSLQGEWFAWPLARRNELIDDFNRLIEFELAASRIHAPPKHYSDTPLFLEAVGGDPAALEERAA